MTRIGIAGAGAWGATQAASAVNAARGRAAKKRCIIIPLWPTDAIGSSAPKQLSARRW